MLVNLLLALAAALAPATTAGGGGEPYRADERAFDSRAQAKLDAARAAWRRAGIRSYRYRLETSCFCGSSGAGRHHFRVRNRRPVKPPKRYRDVATVPRLFRTIQEAIDQRGGTAKVTYRRNGSPKSITDDRVLDAIDDELYYTIDRFKPLR
jgi:hypothetical protein